MLEAEEIIYVATNERNQVADQNQDYGHFSPTKLVRQKVLIVKRGEKF